MESSCSTRLLATTQLAIVARWLRLRSIGAYWVLAFLFGVARAAAVLWFSRLFGQVGAVLGYALREEHI